LFVVVVVVVVVVVFSSLLFMSQIRIQIHPIRVGRGRTRARRDYSGRRVAICFSRFYDVVV
jgi:hypothetical protein